MLSAEQRELITAAVDGELSAAEARAFRRLLVVSPEARVLLARLQADSDRVRVLQGQAVPPANLRAKVMARIAASTPAPSLHVVRTAPTSTPAPLAQPAKVALPSRRSVPTWVPIAVAASVLFCVAAGTVAFLTHNGTTGPSANNSLPHLPAPQDTPNAVPSPNQTAPRLPVPSDPGAVARIDLSPVPPIPHPKEVVPKPVAIAPEPRPAQHNLSASPLFPKLAPFDLIQVRVPFLRAVAELERDDVRQELADELARDPAFRFDLFVRDTARGVDVFQNAAKAAGLTLFSDAATLDKLKKRQTHAVVIYLECLTAEELADLFTKLGAADLKFTPRVCDSIHATPTLRSDESELKAILGVDVGIYKRPVGSNGTGQGGDKPLDKNADPKPVSAGTIDTVTKSLTTPPAKLGEKPAVLMTWQTTHPSLGRTIPATSVELKQFLAKRGDRKPNAVPAIIVIRPVG